MKLRAKWGIAAGCLLSPTSAVVGYKLWQTLNSNSHWIMYCFVVAAVVCSLGMAFLAYAHWSERNLSPVDIILLGCEHDYSFICFLSKRGFFLRV